jgi:DNA segregation ATPase FtsK/SpoIIIE-like protein
MSVPRTFAVALAIAANAASADFDFSRYQIILDRKPFGELPIAAQIDPNAPPPVSFAQGLRLSMIIEEDDTGDMRVGFVDTRSNKSYTLGVGESQDGIRLESASWENEEAILSQGGEMALIKLQSGEVQTITGRDAQNRIDQAASTRPSYAERRKMRQQQMQQEAAALNQQPKYTGDELAKHLYEYQMEVIRQGLPPLPIPLTPEQDQQLVTEGVLPPLQ